MRLLRVQLHALKRLGNVCCCAWLALRGAGRGRYATLFYPIDAAAQRADTEPNIGFSGQLRVAANISGDTPARTSGRIPAPS